MPATAARIPPVLPVLRREEMTEEMAKLVVVAWVVVAWRAVKFWRVEEALERNPPVSVESPVTESEPSVPRLVSDELTTPAPSVVAESTATPPI